jgi:hypothetical protein
MSSAGLPALVVGVILIVSAIGCFIACRKSPHNPSTFDFEDDVIEQLGFEHELEQISSSDHPRTTADEENGYAAARDQDIIEQHDTGTRIPNFSIVGEPTDDDEDVTASTATSILYDTSSTA